MRSLLPTLPALALSAVLALPTALPLSAEPVDLGLYAAKIVPEQVAVVNLPERGTVTDRAADDSHLKKGDVIAILNKEETAQEEEELELSIRRERLNNRDEIRKLEQQRKRIRFYLDLSKEERKYATDLVDETREEPTEEGLRDVNDRIDLLKRELESLERRKRSEFSRKHDQLTLRMPFDGRLQYNVSLPEDPAAPYEHTGTNVQNFATVCDDSAFYVTVSISNAELSTLKDEAFSAELSLPEGRSITAPFSHRRVERSPSGTDMLVYYFRLPEDFYDEAFRMLGSNARARLIYEAGDGALRLSKTALSTLPEAETCSSWEELIERVRPDWCILLITEREIILRKR